MVCLLVITLTSFSLAAKRTNNFKKNPDVILTYQQAKEIYNNTLYLEQATNELIQIIYSQNDTMDNLKSIIENDAKIAKIKSRRKLWLGVGIGSGISAILFVTLDVLLRKK